MNTLGLHAPNNTLLSIDELWLWVSTDETGEGVMAGPLMGQGGPIMPLIAADKTMLETLRPWAEHIAQLSGKPARLIKFSNREVVDTIGIQ